jgi:lysophospholipase
MKATPLVSIPEAPVPDHGAAEWFSGAGGITLRAVLFAPEGAAKGSAIVSPGRSEPLEKYFEVVRELLGRGLKVLVHDWRGQGLSTRLLPERLKGHAEGFMPFVKDYSLLLDHFESRLPKPWIAVSHSMGGMLTLAALAAGEKRLAAAILTAPMIAVNTGERPYGQSRMLAWMGAHSPLRSKFLFGARGDPSTHTFETEGLTHDRGRYETYAAQLRACPDLALGNITWAWLDSAFAMTSWLKGTKGVEAIDVPVTILSAELDDRVSNPAQAEIVARLKKGRLLTVKGAYHEILMETDPIRAVFWQAFDALWEIVEE